MNKLFDFNIDLKLRLFYVLAWTACIANTLGYISNALLYGFTMATIFPLGCSIIIYAASAYGMSTKNTKFPALLILIICNFLEFPVLYCLYGPYRLSYMMLGIVTTALFLENKWRIAGTSLLILFDSFLIACKVSHPEFFLPLIIKESTISAVITFLIACTSITAMSGILLKQYTKQQERMKEMTEKLQQMAHLDPLTQLYNRRYLTQYLEKMVAEQGSPFTVVLLDIDNFKQINDTYGHIFGDEALQEFSHILLRHIKGHGIATRFGGEEFMLVFLSTDQSEMRSVLERCAADFAQFGLSTKKVPMTFSGGTAIFRNEDMLVKLFNAADAHLYQAKNAGKKQVVYE